MEFHFEIIDQKYACLTKISDCDKVVLIPDQWQGYPVTKIGSRTFEGQHEIVRVKLPKDLIEIEDHAFAECRFLEQMEFPDGMKKIGDYCFYNCIRLQRIVLPESIELMGYGAFKNNSDLKDIHLYTKVGEESKINVILSETYFDQTVTFYYDENHISQLVFTEFLYEETANEEARQFNHKTYGTGSLYRNCISSSGIDYLKYDEIFDLTVHRDEPDRIMDIALKRLRYPYELSVKAKENYIHQLKQMGKKTLCYMIDTKRWSCLSLLEADEPFLKEDIEAAIDYARNKNVYECISLLMQYKSRYYPSVSKSFEL